MSNISIVLVKPRGEANIGAVARAMKNFGVNDLRLVKPVPYMTDEALSWAVDAKEILENAKTFDTIKDALKDRSSTFAFTRRVGRSRRRDMKITDASEEIARFSKSAGVALVFGTEDAGLSNEEISMCDQIITIPTSSSLPSLNLSQAVIITCYEIAKRISPMDGKSSNNEDWRYVDRKQITFIMGKLEHILIKLKYEDGKDNPVKTKIINQFNKLFGRAGLTDRDIRMFEGLLSRIDKMISP